MYIADFLGGMFAAHGIMAALYERDRTGRGQKVEVSLIAGTIAMLGHLVPEYFAAGEIPVGPEIGFKTALSGIFKAKDGHVVWSMGGQQTFWPNLCRGLGHPELEKDPRFDTITKRRERWQELKSVVDDILLTRTADEWEQRLLAEDVPCGKVKSVGEALADPQLRHQKGVASLDYLGGEVRLAANPIKMSATANQVYGSPPTFGQHTDEVLSQILQYSPQKIAQLRQSKVVF